MSNATTSLQDFLPATASSRQLSLPTRPLKVSFAVAVALLGAYGVLSERQYISTGDAVVSSYVLELRTPIEGRLQNAPSTAGDTVQAGSLLGRVGNELMDHEHLDDLRLREQAAEATAHALLQESQSLATLRASLVSRAALHRSAIGSRLAHETESARLVLEAKETALREAEVEAERGSKLADWGVLSRAAFEKVDSARQVLRAEVRSQRATVGALETENKSLVLGVLSEPGTNNDVAYSTQRADELTLKLAENARDLAAAQAQAKEAKLAVDREGARALLLQQSELRAPSGGMVWKLNAVNGEHIVAGSPVLSMVDCTHEFVLAAIPQDRASTILLNSKVDVKLTGEDVQRSGTVMTVSGDPQRNLDGKLAATPLRKLPGDFATVVIRLDPAAQSSASPALCLVGRTARVRIPTVPTNLVSLWLSQRL